MDMSLLVGGRASAARLLGAALLLACGHAEGEFGTKVHDDGTPATAASDPALPVESHSPTEAPPTEAAPAEVPRAEELPALPDPNDAWKFPNDSRRSTIDNMLSRECSACHEGPSAERNQSLDLEMLVENLKLWKGAAETSSLVLWLQYGSSRREHWGVRVKAEELDALVGYINSLEPLNSLLGYDLVDRDRAQELMLLDISQRALADQPFIRYVGPVRTSAGYHDSGGLPEHFAFEHLVNTISLMPELVPLGYPLEGSAIHAIDLRDYGWTEPVDVDQAGHFADRWSAIVAAAGPYALELQGPEADALKQATQTPIPFLSASVFVAHAAVGPLYSALVGLGSDVSALAASRGVDSAKSIPWRAGRFGAQGVPDSVVTRHEQAAFPGQPWWTRDELRMAPGGGEAGLARDPVHYESSSTEVIFSLPNGLYAYAIAGADGRRLDELPCTGDMPCAGPVRAKTSVTCRGCHDDQPLGAPDEVLPYLFADPTRYAPGLVPLIRDQYRPDLWAAAEADSVRTRSVREANLNGVIPAEIVARTYYRFKGAVNAGCAANDLGVQIDEVRAAITALGGAASDLAPLLGDGTVDRDRFTSQFQALACAIEGPRNQPSRCP